MHPLIFLIARVSNFKLSWKPGYF